MCSAMIIVVANSKGGVGKSTLSVHLAAWLHEQGHTVILADCDTQHSSSEWIEEAVPGVSTVRLATPNHILDQLPALASRKRITWWPTGPAAIPRPAAPCCCAADLAIVPCKASMLEVRRLAQATNGAAAGPGHPRRASPTP